MKLNIVFREENGWFVGHIQEYPDFESQGKTLDQLKENLLDIYEDIQKTGIILINSIWFLEVVI